MNLRKLLLAVDEAYKRGNPAWLWNPGQTLPEVQNRSLSGCTKKGLMSFKKCIERIDKSNQLTSTVSQILGGNFWHSISSDVNGKYHRITKHLSLIRRKNFKIVVQGKQKKILYFDRLYLLYLAMFLLEMIIKMSKMYNVFTNYF